MILTGKIIYRRTIIDIPLLLFVAGQFLATIFSVDPHTSLFGYYGRFNGGLLSIISYSILFFVFTNNFEKKSIKKLFYSLFVSSLFVCLYGILQHLGIDKNYWHQDVQVRVFSTFGQPNWLAAWLVAIIPVTLTYLLKKNNNLFLLLVFLQTTTLVFTKSRSGIIAFAATILIFVPFVYHYFKKRTEKFKIPILVSLVSVIFIPFLFFKTPWTPKINLNNSTESSVEENIPALEAGGTESGEIRKIVWKGALDVFKSHPLLGSGVETFAYSYYEKRPKEHNLVSEWDYLYNKAHNEYLNYLATTGVLGTTTYLIFIASVLFLLYKKSKKSLFAASLFCGYVSILITNSVGFSVTAINHLFFLFPAIAIVNSQKASEKSSLLESKNKLFLIFPIAFYVLLFSKIINLWIADYQYSIGKSLNLAGRYVDALQYLEKTIKLEPSEAVYQIELGKSYTKIAVDLAIAGSNKEEVFQLANLATQTSDYALELEPANMNVRRNHAANLLALSVVDRNYLEAGKVAIENSTKLAPTDAKLFYNLGLTQYQLNQTEQAETNFAKAVELKENYVDARYALAVVLYDLGKNTEALEQTTYLIDKMNVQREDVAKLHESLKNPQR